MSGQPKRERLLKVLGKLACEEIGPEAAPLDWVSRQVEGGATMPVIAERIKTRLGEGFSHDWMRWQIVRLEPDAKARLAAARVMAANQPKPLPVPAAPLMALTVANHAPAPALPAGDIEITDES
jgi:hypothetical protein